MPECVESELAQAATAAFYALTKASSTRRTDVPSYIFRRISASLCNHFITWLANARENLPSLGRRRRNKYFTSRLSSSYQYLTRHQRRYKEKIPIPIPSIETTKLPVIQDAAILKLPTEILTQILSYILATAKGRGPGKTHTLIWSLTILSVTC